MVMSYAANENHVSVNDIVSGEVYVIVQCIWTTEGYENITDLGYYLVSC